MGSFVLNCYGCKICRTYNLVLITLRTTSTTSHLIACCTVFATSHLRNFFHVKIEPYLLNHKISLSVFPLSLPRTLLLWSLWFWHSKHPRRILQCWSFYDHHISLIIPCSQDACMFLYIHVRIFFLFTPKNSCTTDHLSLLIHSWIHGLTSRFSQHGECCCEHDCIYSSLKPCSGNHFICPEIKLWMTVGGPTLVGSYVLGWGVGIRNVRQKKTRRQKKKTETQSRVRDVTQWTLNSKGEERGKILLYHDTKTKQSNYLFDTWNTT